MAHRRSVMMVTAMGLLAAFSGCAARTDAARAAAPVVAALRPSTDLSGTWRGSFSQPGGSIYADEGKCVLQIREDGTFTAAVTPNPAANSHATASTFWGTVVRSGDRVTLKSAQGPAPSMKLTRSGDVLYGVVNDPATEWDVLVKLEREETGR